MAFPTYYPDPFATVVSGVLGPIVRIGVFAAPFGWLLAAVAIWRPFPHVFAILSRWFVAVHAAAGALILASLVGALASGQALGENVWGLGFLVACLSGALAWIVVGRRSRPEERLPSLF